MDIGKRVSVLVIGGVCTLAIASKSAADQQHNTAVADAGPATEVPSVEAVVTHLEGVMSTTAQAASDPDFVAVQMTTCRVTPTDAQPDSVYLYQEQALIEDLAAPYRQRFLQVMPGSNNRIDSRTFRPNTPEAWIGLCSRTEQPMLTAALGEPICTVSLRISSVGGYVGSTPEGGCPANVRGAVSITNIVVLHANGMDTWDRGFDAEGNQAWGAQEVPYQYRR